MKKVICILISLFLLVGCGTDQSTPSVQIPEGKIAIALLDTGISTDAIAEESLLPGYNYVTESDDTTDNINHGTANASVIVGSESAGIEAIAPNAFLIPLVVTDMVDDAQKSVTPDVLAQAIRDAVDVYGANIINVSLGLKADNDEVQSAVEYAEENGVLVVAAVGNSGEQSDLYYPAAYETVLGVGSHNNNYNVSSFSQQNGTADILAPGEGRWLASRTGATYGAKGTSYATAYVSAAAAAVLELDPEITPAEMRELLKSTATDIGDDGWDSASGYGVLNLDSALLVTSGGTW